MQDTNTSQKLRILIVDDTITYRTVLSRVVERVPFATVTATAKDGLDALEKIESNTFDVVFLDVEMPRLTGPETLERLKQKHPDLPVIMVSSASRTNARITIECLEAGALDFIDKPECDDSEENAAYLLLKLKPLLAHIQETQAKKKASLPSPAPSVQVAPRTVQSEKAIQALCIGVSTGGPKALMAIIPKLPKLDIPVFIVIHMPPVFTHSMAQRLDSLSQLTVVEAADHEAVVSNTVYIAPGGRHMKVVKTGVECTIKLDDSEHVNSCRPAVDYTWRSIADSYRGNVLSVILTGMGQDGTQGVKLLKELGATSFTQTEDSCVVYGMPRSVVEAGLSDHQYSVEQMSDEIVNFIMKRNRKPQLA